MIKDQDLSTPTPFNTVVVTSPTQEAIPPIYVTETTDKNIEGCEKNLKYLGTALEMFATEHSGAYPESLAILLKPSYIREIPLCPSCGKDTYSESYKAHKNPDSYLLYCKGENHKKSGLQKNFPQYSVTKGLIEGAKTNKKPEDNGNGKPEERKEEKTSEGCCRNLKNLATSLEMYMVDYMIYPDKLQNLVKCGYISKMPICPACGKDSYIYKHDKKPDSYVIYCSGNYHKKEGIPENYPRFENQCGLKEKP
jgi:hypothetical protein